MMSLFNRFQGVFFSPQPTFKALSEKPVWKDALIILLIVMAIYSFIIAPYASQDTLKTYKDNIKLQDQLGKERYERMIKTLENPSTSSIIARTVLFVPLMMLIGWLIAGVVLLVIGRMFSTEGSFLLVFAAMLHANFIDKIFGSALRLILVLMRKSVIQTTTSLALLMPNVDYTSTAYSILTQFDFFQLWMFGVLGYGLSSIFKISVKNGMIISYSFWALKSLIFFALSFLTKGLMGM